MSTTCVLAGAIEAAGCRERSAVLLVAETEAGAQGAPLGRPLLKVDLTRGTLYQHLDLGVLDGWERITAEVPPPPVRALLRLPRGGAALAVERLVRADGVPIEHRRSLLRGDRYLLEGDWRPKAGAR